MVTRVQSARGTALEAYTIGVELSQSPTSGNVLIACIGLDRQNYESTVSTITQDGVTWQKIVSQTNGYLDTEIWAGDVGESASGNVSVNLDPANPYYSVADICEYSGLQSADVDKYASTSGTGTTTDTGTTEDETTQNYELWIGATSYLGAQGLATNGFAVVDEEQFYDISLAYLERMVGSTGHANSGTVNQESADWSGCVATFKVITHTITASADDHSSISPSGTVIVFSADQTFSITANSGYHIVNVYVDDEDQGPSSTYTFYNVTANHTIAVTSAANFTCYITASADDHSSISPSGTVNVESGQHQEFSISANSGYHITNVYVDSVNQGAIYTYTFSYVAANHTISVTSAVDPSDLEVRDLTVDRDITILGNMKILGGLSIGQ